jgi:hypothetical protein
VAYVPTGALLAGDNWRAGPEVDFRAAQLLVAWYRPLTDARFAGLEPLLRVSWADPDTEQPDDGALLLTPGLNLYVAGRNRFGVNVDLYDPATGESAWSLKVQSALYF